MRERAQAQVATKTVSVWSYFLYGPAARAGCFLSPFYRPPGHMLGDTLHNEHGSSSHQIARWDMVDMGAGSGVQAIGEQTVLYPSHLLKKLTVFNAYFNRWYESESLHGGLGKGSVSPYGAIAPSIISPLEAMSERFEEACLQLQQDELLLACLRSEIADLKQAAAANC